MKKKLCVKKFVADICGVLQAQIQCSPDYDQSAYTGLPFSVVNMNVNISYNITHILYIDRRIHSALYWLTAFYQPQNLSSCSEWIILDHPVFLICERAGSCSPRHFRTPPMVPSTLPRTALNSSYFIQNTDPFFQIHWYSAILDYGWFWKCLKTIWIYNWRNWMQLLVLLCTIPKKPIFIH